MPKSVTYVLYLQVSHAALNYRQTFKYLFCIYRKTPLQLIEYDGDDDVPDNPGDPEIDQPLLRVDLSDLDQLQNPSTARSAYREAMTGAGCYYDVGSLGNACTYSCCLTQAD